MKQFKSRKQNRLNRYNYSTSGYYSVTICTQNREYIFGDINGNEMILNQYGDIVRNSWLDISNHHKNIQLDEFIVMPNHIHGIINIVRAADLPPLQNNDRSKMMLSKIIHGVKSTVTRQINKTHKLSQPIWQRNYHDHIIRNDKSLNTIREYIINNPKNWELDENNINFLEVQAGLNPTG